MTARDRAFKLLPLAAVGLAILFAFSACETGPPSRAECMARWNDAGNRASQMEVVSMGFPRAYVAGWPTKAGDHCSATFFTGGGEPWVMFVLWVDAPEPRARFGSNVAGSRYGRGELGAEKPSPPNAEVEDDGTLSEL